MTEIDSRPIMESNQALQAALELSMLNLNNTTYSTTSPDPPFGLFDDSPLLGSKKSASSQNITQCVAVPSSEHVAEIVGRQGCKIKALRAKTNTYIKTPVRGEDPTFIITGRPEDVSAAKREILGAAEHFTQIRTARRSNSNSSPNNFGSPTEENKVTIFVRVPYRVVGLVVGPKGATVKRIQQITNTYIVTPSRDKEPCFEVTGSPENVERARKEIESYIAMRTGGSIDSDYEGDFQAVVSPSADSVFSPMNHLSRRVSETSTKMFQFPGFSRSSASPPDNGPYFRMDGGFDAFTSFERPVRNSPLSSAVFGSSSEGSVDSYQGCLMPMSAPVPSSSERVFDFSDVQDALAAMKPQPPSPTGSCESNSSEGTAVTSPKQSPKLPHAQRMVMMNGTCCCMCQEQEVVAALVPCGHNLFCFPCARKIACTSGNCPVCSTQVTTVLRIYTH